MKNRDIRMKNSLIERIVEAKCPFLIAEIGINHNGDISLEKDMIIAAKDSTFIKKRWKIR